MLSALLSIFLLRQEEVLHIPQFFQVSKSHLPTFSVIKITHVSGSLSKSSPFFKRFASIMLLLKSKVLDFHSYPNLYKIQTFFLNAVLGTFSKKKVWILFLFLQG